MAPHDKFTAMRADLTAALIERDQEIDLCLTALVAREHVLLVGPPGCLHGATPIHDPVDDTTRTVRQRHRMGLAFHVAAKDHAGNLVTARAEAPWQYPTAPMFRVTTAHGLAFTVTAGHRFWDGSQYVSVADTRERLQRSERVLLPTTEEFSCASHQEPCESFATRHVSAEPYRRMTELHHTERLSRLALDQIGQDQEEPHVNMWQEDHILSIEPAGCHPYYDFHVPGYENYLACGTIHHNTAKSMLSDAIVRWMNGTRFQILLTKFTTPEEVFGPVSLAGLKVDHYRRITTGKLPAAEVAFVDEIFKSSSAILNTLLTVLNERLFDNDGARVACPLQLCVAASNEWPGGGNGEGKELGALFDRFLLRKTVSPIASARGIDRLLWSPTEIQLSTTIDPDELCQAQTEAIALPWTDGAKTALLAILREAKQEGIFPGDRRMKKSITVGQAYAWLQGHAAVETDDLEILAHVLWDDPTEQPAKLAQIVGRIANPEGMKINTLLMEAEQVIGETDLKDLAQTATACKKLAEVHGKLTAAPGAKAQMAAEHVAAEVKRIRLASVESL